MKIFLVTLLVTLMVFLNSVESMPPRRSANPFPDLNYIPHNREVQFRYVYGRHGAYYGIRHGEEKIPPVPVYPGAKLYNSDHTLIGFFDGRAFYNKPDTEPDREVVYPENGSYVSETGLKKDAIFNNVWRPAAEDILRVESTPNPSAPIPDTRTHTGAAESMTPRRAANPFPDLNYVHHNREVQFRYVYGRHGAYYGIRHGEEKIPPVPMYPGAKLYNSNNEIIGFFDGKAFYNKPDVGPDREVVYPDNGCYASYDGITKKAIFHNVWRPAPKDIPNTRSPTGASGASGEGSSRTRY